jgi:lipopolysaccharide transport system ATP-binding protein
MYVKLAFAVIAHVDADILVIDEALAVGDAVFIQKCMRFIRSFQERGTLLFVSHDTASVQNLCRSAIWLGSGQVKQEGLSKDVAEAYFQYTMQEVYGDEVVLNDTSIEKTQTTASIQVEPSDGSSASETACITGNKVASYDNMALAKGWESGGASILSATLTSVDGGAKGVLAGGEKVRLLIRAKAYAVLKNALIGFLVRDRLGQDLFGENTFTNSLIKPCAVLEGQEFEAEFLFEFPMLPNGQYSMAMSVANGDLHNNVQHHWLHDALIINVSSSKIRYGLMGIKFSSVGMEVV